MYKIPITTMDCKEVDIEHDFKSIELINPHARIDRLSINMVHAWRYM